MTGDLTGGGEKISPLFGGEEAGMVLIVDGTHPAVTTRETPPDEPEETVMAARTERDTLNGLIEICRDSAKGFRLAADHVADPELKRLFEEAARQREVFAVELVPYAQRLGGRIETPGTTAAALHRGWIRIKDVMSGYDERAVLAEALRGESVAANTYAEAVMNLLPPNARPVIERQYAEIRSVQHELDEIALPAA
jgi:uncharacterized protein (TIGR02284 family)